jgi:ammonia channel protein AmtB
MNKWLELLVGLILVIVAVVVWMQNYWNFGTAALDFFRGGLVWLVLGIGALFILLGISDLKE